MNNWTKLSIEFANQRNYLVELGLDKIWERCSEPKETNRQIGPLFRRWINKGVLGVSILKIKEFLATKENAVKAVKITILDGVLYIEGNNKMYKDITTTYADYNIMSALVLREFLFQL